MARSKAYPIDDLGESERALGVFTKALGPGSHDRESICQALGYKKAHGYAARKVAALVHYGLLQKAAEGQYVATDLAARILHPRDDDDYSDALVKACGAPALHAQLLEKYQAHGSVPGQLANILVRDHGITASASADAADVFLKSARHAGLLKDDNTFIVREAGPDEPGGDPSSVSSSHSEEVQEDSAPGGGAQEARLGGAKDSPGPNGSQTFSIGLSGGTARLSVPETVTARDLQKLRKLIELLEFDVEANE